MTSRLILPALGTMLLLGAIAPATAATNLVTNGGFEDQAGVTGSNYDLCDLVTPR